MVPTGKSGKEFVNEITRLLNPRVDNSSLKDIAFKAIMVLPSLLLQDNCAALQHRLTLWHNGNVLELLKEGVTIQGTLKTFLKKMQQVSINCAIKLLTNNMQNKVLRLNEKTLELLRQSHPKASPATESVILTDDVEKVHPIIIENIMKNQSEKLR